MCFSLKSKSNFKIFPFNDVDIIQYLKVAIIFTIKRKYNNRKNLIYRIIKTNRRGNFTNINLRCTRDHFIHVVCTKVDKKNYINSSRQSGLTLFNDIFDSCFFFHFMLSISFLLSIQLKIWETFTLHTYDCIHWNLKRHPNNIICWLSLLQ